MQLNVKHLTNRKNAALIDRRGVGRGMSCLEMGKHKLTQWLKNYLKSFAQDLNF